MKFKSLVFVIASTVLVSNVYADNTAGSSSDTDTDTDQTLDNQDKPNTWGIGVAGLISPVPYKDTSSTILPLPVISYQGENLRISGPFISYKFLNYEYAKTSVQAYLYPEHFRSNKSTDSQMQQLDNRNYIVMGGINQKFLSPYGIFNFSFNIDMTGQSNGFSIISRYNIPFVFNKVFGDDRLVFNPGIGLQYSSHLLTNYYYGISSSETNSSGLPTYHPDGSFSPFISLTTAYSFAGHWTLALINTVTRLDNTVYDSPMVEKRYIVTTYGSVVYKF
ncbi:MipA/OmpV family protein [Thiotrichales bacterium 19S3-7]|nr:MipA/OmpV family protein [Thiotrichales bacterium 19S3-7]MCF6801252.1 MipA/OmpV family protein [Thiotrichales bacterium 19S3-11]